MLMNFMLKNKAGYTAQDAPSMRTFHLLKLYGTYGRRDRRTDTTSHRDATAHLKIDIKNDKQNAFRQQ